ncbi:MAG: M48 family metalloprotease [Nocardioidaceae bacterium]
MGERRCRVRPGRLDWYIRDDPEPNAFAAGRRSVAVTSGFLQLLQTGRLSHDEAVAVVIHEIGHHATRATRHGLLAEWLCWPWRVTYRACMRLGGTMPYAEAGMLLMPVVFMVAIAQTAQLDAPPEQLIPVLTLLATLALGIFVAPLLDAAFARASERAADRFTTQHGAGPDLAAALHQVGTCQPSGLLGRLCHPHPATSARLARLTSTAALPTRPAGRPDLVADGVTRG